MTTLINFNQYQFDVYNCINPNDLYLAQHNYSYEPIGPSHINFLSWGKEQLHEFIAEGSDDCIVVVWRKKTTPSINQIINL